jgi:hypothetical protein
MMKGRGTEKAMTDFITQPSSLPEIARADARAIFLGHWYVGDEERGRAALDEVMKAWQGIPWPAGILNLSCYISADRDTALTYAQCTDDSSYLPFVGALPIAREQAWSRPRRCALPSVP